MTEPTLALQKGIRSRLVEDAEVTASVAPERIFDGRTRPENFPCIIIGEGQSVLEAISYSRKHVRLFLDAHIWTKETGLFEVKTITGAVASALRSPPTIDAVKLIDFTIAGSRFLRDPANEFGHAVVSLEALVEIIE